MRMKQLPSVERPREKAIIYGIKSLKNRELLAVLLRTGYRGGNALDLADDLLVRFGSISGILKASIPQLCEVRGISKAKALEISAVGELSFRGRQKESLRFFSAREIYDHYRSRLDSLNQEEVILLCFN